MVTSAAERATTQRRARTAAAAAIKELSDTGGADPFASINVGVRYAGRHITLPELPVPMPLPTAIETLQRKHEEDEEEMAVNETVDAFPKDGAVAFHQAMQRMFG